MATLALTALATTVAGSIGTATVGAALAGAALTAGASVVGGVVDNALFGPKPPDIEGPRLDETVVAGAGEGQAVKRFHGTVRVAGNRFWQTRFKEVATTKKVGGKGGALGGGQKQTTYEYYASFAILIGEGAIEAVETIYADGQEMDLGLPAAYTIYDGTQTEPDPTILATEGAAPAYLGLSYIVFEDVPLSSFSSRIPAIAVVVRRSSGQTVRTALAAIAADAGLALDVSAAPETPLRGYKIDRPMSPRAAIGGLATAYHLDMALADSGVLKIVPRYGAPVARIAEADLVGEGDGGGLVYARSRPEDAPAEVRLDFPNPDRGYQPGSVGEVRSLAPGGGTASQQTTVVLTQGEAQALAASALEDAWRQRETVRGVLSPEHARRHRVGDFIEVETDRGYVYTIRIDRLAFEWTGPFDGRIVASTPAEAGVIDGGSTLSPAYGDPQAVSVALMDLPLLLGAEVEHTPHIAAWGESWRGANIYRSPSGDGFVLAGSVPVQATTGILTTALAAGPEWDVDAAPDPSVVTVALDHGTLVSATAAQLDAGANALAVQDVTGAWEIVQFGTATLIAPGAYDLTDLRRARRGTDGQMIHSAGARVVLIDPAIRQVEYPREQRGAIATYRYGPSTRAVDNALYAQVERAFQGAGLRPFSPVALTAIWGEGDAEDDIIIGWTRRDRRGFDPISKPMSELEEIYEIVIRSGATELRTLTATEETVTYLSADHVADVALGPGQTLDVEVFQISAAVGRGTGRRTLLTLPAKTT